MSECEMLMRSIMIICCMFCFRWLRHTHKYCS